MQRGELVDQRLGSSEAEGRAVGAEGEGGVGQGEGEGTDRGQEGGGEAPVGALSENDGRVRMERDLKGRGRGKKKDNCYLDSSSDKKQATGNTEDIKIICTYIYT